ncbi:MAG: hypothetical protein WBH31_13225 [Promethearchaeia archaeon]
MNMIDTVCKQIEVCLRFTVDSNLIKRAKIIRDHKKEIFIFPLPKPKFKRISIPIGNKRD